jgi:hypothetical protein
MTRFRFCFRLLIVVAALAAIVHTQAASAQDASAETPRLVVFEAFMRPG